MNRKKSRTKPKEDTRPSPPLESPGVFLKEVVIDEVELVLPHGYMQKIREHLFSDTSREYICHLLCGHTLLGNRLRFLACYCVTPEPEDYLEQSIASIRLHPDYDLNLRKECKLQKLSLIDIHSHPFSGQHVGFSGIDDHDEVDKYYYFERNLPESAFGSIVMSPHAEEGRIFLSAADSRRPRVLPLKIICRDVPLTGAKAPAAVAFDEQRYDRQVRAFGLEGQKNLATMKVGVVGVGGLGSSIAIGLARLGVKDITLIDPDRAEPTNLNRLAGMTSVDARLNPYKVDLVARRIAEIEPDSVIDACASDLFEPGAWQKLRDQDILIASTDNHSTRMLLNSISHQYLIPLVSVGTQIKTLDEAFDNGFGELYSVLPGQPRPCLLCSQYLDKAEAYYELGSEENRREAAERGYIEGFDAPAPAVYHLNGLMTNLALIEIHNMVCGFMARRPHIIYSMVECRLLTYEDEEMHCGVCSPGGWNFARGDQLDPVSHLFGPPGSTAAESEFSEKGEVRDELRRESI